LRRFLLLASPFALFLWPFPANAGTLTIESIFSLQAARRMAIGQIPRDAVVTRVSCLDIDVHGDDRYRCTVYYTPGPAESQP
jgi:hypothetical protein